MDFDTLFKKISLSLKRMAKAYNGHGFFIDGEDLYQEMCLHLWEKFRDGSPGHMNRSYIIKGCEFHIRNFIRKQRQKEAIVSLEEAIDDNGRTLADVIPDAKEPLGACISREMAIEDVKNNGLTKKEKKALSLLIEGYTVREAGERMGISHVRVVKIKKRIIEKWRQKREGVTKDGRYLL